MEKSFSMFIESTKKNTPDSISDKQSVARGRKRKKPKNDTSVNITEWNIDDPLIKGSIPTDNIEMMSDSSSDNSTILLPTIKRTIRKGQPLLGGVSKYMSCLKDDKQLIEWTGSPIDDTDTPSLINSDTPSSSSHDHINSDTPSSINKNSPTPAIIPSIKRQKISNADNEQFSETCSSVADDTSSEREWGSPVQQSVKQTAGNLSRTSNWIKQLAANNEEFVNSTSTVWSMSLCNSSAKKKSRRRSIRPGYIQGGLADRMQRIIEREKSNLSFWSYSSRNSNENVEDNSSSITVQINSSIIAQSLLCTEATLLSADNSSAVTYNGESIFVFFTMDCAEQLPINIESVVRIASPWQSVILSDDNGQYNNKLVVFSTQYCTLVKEGRHGNVPIKEKTPVKQVQTTVTSFNELNSSIKPILSASVCSRKLFGQENSFKKTRGTLVDVFDVTRYDSLSLIVTIRAVYVHTHSVIGSHRWMLLMEDDCRLFMELIIDEKHVSTWKDIINNGLGNRFEVYNLQFVKRISSSQQKPMLFQLIESIVSMNNYSQQTFLQCGSNICCFILKTQDNSYWNRMLPCVDKNVKMLRTCVPVSLCNVRVTCPAKIILVSSDLESYTDRTIDAKEQNIFIYAIILTNSLQNSPSLVKIRLLMGFVVMDTILPGNVFTISNGLLVQEPLHKKDTDDNSVFFYLDSYSLLIPRVETLPTNYDVISPIITIDQSDISLLSSFDFSQLPSLSHKTMTTNNLVTVEGIIVQVDETDAFVWLTCPDCGSCLESLTANQQSYVCSECDTIEPNVNVQISVTLFDSRNPNLKPSIELSQETAHEILPISLDCVSKGLDASYLINKFISLDVCLITDIHEGEKVYLKEVTITRELL